MVMRAGGWELIMRVPFWGIQDPKLRDKRERIKLQAVSMRPWKKRSLGKAYEKGWAASAPFPFQ